MWTMGYNEGGPDSFNGGRRLRPLIPRLSPCPTNTVNTDSDHRFNMVMTTMTADQNKREMQNSETQHPPVMVSSRWNPTPDQLRVLEELYRQGTRTPSADHIQQITSQLRLYGKIEGKNVFYWFQNHKARERQKRRRQMETEQHGSEESAITTNLRGFEKKDQPGYRVEQTKNWVRSVGCDIPPEKLEDRLHHHHEEEEEELISITAKRNGRHGGDDRQSFSGRNSLIQLPPGLYPSSHHHHHHNFILNSTTVSSFMSTSKSTISDAKDTVTISPVFLSTRPISRSQETCTLRNDNTDQEQLEDCSNKDDSDPQEQTLELFPLRKEGFCSNGGDVDQKEKETGLHFFYEFLPLKN